MDQTSTAQPLDIGCILRKLADHSARPRYAFMVLNLISEVADSAGHAGPTIVEGDRALLLRDWLSDALAPMARGEARLSLSRRVAAELAGELPADPALAEVMLAAAIDARIRVSSKSNISRAVGDLLRAGLVRRHYAGWWTNHQNRGGQRSAVYTVEAEALAALRRRSLLL